MKRRWMVFSPGSESGGNRWCLVFALTCALWSLPARARAQVARPNDVPVSGGAACQSFFCYVHSSADAGVGKGLRLNNPFRLQTQLGATAESLSASASYLDLRVSSLLGDPFGWHHGLSLGVNLALEGIAQQVVTGAWVSAYPVSPRFWLQGYLGAPVVVEPEFNVGVEVALQAKYWALAGIGPYVALVFDQFWGAATDQTEAAWIPIVAVQAGVSVRYEVIP